ncbi:hypothetical protein HOLleu_03458 [Holothuria leucospilota]|uniref:Uncharacterized protein n=1 Tax=Holothuria leucospilota TaxID=206669 RepID=A0A9Q1CSK8_HOLLE|nr:hypothetical protein HOLleu_03458 [Holothuria leucospilota]
MECLQRENSKKGGFLVQYKGERISLEEAERREKKYETQNRSSHCYLYYFTDKGKTVW